MIKPALLITSLVMFCIACSQPDRTATNENERPASTSPIDGNWELIESQAGGKTVKLKRPQQLKILNDGFFSFIHFKPDGSFQESGAGTYNLDGNQYKETLRYCSDSAIVGYTDQQTWELRGDTLIFAGFKKVFDRTGKEMPANTWGGDTFIEKRVRAKL